MELGRRLNLGTFGHVRKTPDEIVVCLAVTSITFPCDAKEHKFLYQHGHSMMRVVEVVLVCATRTAHVFVFLCVVGLQEGFAIQFGSVSHRRASTVQRHNTTHTSTLLRHCQHNLPRLFGRGFEHVPCLPWFRLSTMSKHNIESTAMAEAEADDDFAGLFSAFHAEDIHITSAAVYIRHCPRTFWHASLGRPSSYEPPSSGIHG
jgi:hypothetical protein